MRDGAVRELLAQRFGFAPAFLRQRDVSAAIVALAAEAGLDERVLVARLPIDRALLGRLAGRVSISESYFLRHEAQLAAVVHRLAAFHAKAGLRAWSAGCGRGEEAYSLVMLARAAGVELDVLGTDLDADAIQVANAARFEAWSLRQVPPAFLTAHFRRAGTACEVRADHRRHVELRCESIQETLRGLAPSSFDVVLFRNVAIYLGPGAVEQIYEGIAQVLRPGGLLVVAATDPLPPPALFRADPSDPTGVLHRTHHTGARTEAPPRARSTRPEPALHPKPRPPRSDPALRIVPDRLVEPAVRLEVDRRCSAGDHAGALAPLDALIAASPDHVEAHLLRGQVLLAHGDLAPAADAFRRALYYAPAHRIGRHWYLLALRRLGEDARVEKLHRELERALAALPADAPLEDGETTVQDLRETLRHAAPRAM